MALVINVAVVPATIESATKKFLADDPSPVIPLTVPPEPEGRTERCLRVSGAAESLTPWFDSVASVEIICELSIINPVNVSA
ncbi:MAG: hypothetical protein IT292_00860 [Deltaproteobacteria bacterium]|nr:hypothetical protein [Deltaproteobacteria bacterium]